MICPYCSTDNRIDRESCYHCGKDISMLRLIVNKARHHYNVALEHAERQRYGEALAELEHSIDLDRHFVPAHVVMGTVYAKMEKYEEAERCWETALALDPHIKKAHDYLGKSAVVQAAGPTLKRLNRMTWAALAVVVVFALLSVWQLWPTHGRKELAQISSQIEKGDYGAAFESAQALQHSARRAEIRRAAGLLVAAIDQRFQNAAEKILTFLLENEPLKAHELYSTLVVQNAAPKRYRVQLEPLDRKAAEQVISMIDSWQKGFDHETISYEELVKNVKRVRVAFDRREVVEKADMVLASVRRTRADRILAAVPSSAESTTETLKWLGRLHDLAAEVPQVRDKVGSATARLLDEAVGRIRREVDRALAVGDTASLQLALGGLELLRPYGLPKEGEAIAERIREGLKRVDVGQLLAFLQSATIDDIPKVAVLTAQYEGVTTATAENAGRLLDAISRARRRLALEMLQWCEQRDSRFETRRISTEEAQFTVDRAEFVLRYIRAKDWHYVRDNTMFYALSSWLKLGNEAEAERWYQRLVNTYPDSPYVEVARRWRQETGR